MFKFKGEVQIFPGTSGWVYVSVPRELTDNFSNTSHFGMKPIQATVGKTTWKTTLMPMGDGTYFVALKAAVRKKERISIGDTIDVTFIIS